MWRSVSVRLLLLTFLFLTIRAFGNDAALIWEDHFDLAGSINQARAISVGHQRAVAIGVASVGSSCVELLVRAYDTLTGSLLWQDQSPLAAGYITNVVIDDVGQRVFGAGYVQDGLGTDIMVRAYNVTTGDRLWEDVIDKGRDGFPQGIAAGRSGVYVVGYAGNSSGSALEFLVRAYNPKTGALLWEDEIEDADSDDTATAVAIEGDTLFVAGSRRNSTSQEVILRAYNASNGDLQWEKRYARGTANALTVSGTQVYIGGIATTAGGDSGSFIAAYDSSTGNLNWQHRNAANSGAIIDLAADDSHVFAAGSLGLGMLVRSYDATTGQLLWQDKIARPDDRREFASAIDITRNLVFVAGRSGVEFGPSQFFVRAYKADSGKVLWEDRAHETSDSAAVDISAKYQKVFAVGWYSTRIGSTDFLIRAYDAR